MPVRIICKTCHTEFSVSPCRAAAKVFCSRSCYAKEQGKGVYNQHLSRRKSKRCAHCGKSFTYHAYRNRTALYCSRSCSSSSRLGAKGTHWKGDEVGYGGLHDWIRKRLGTPQLCEHCGSTSAKRYEWANKSGDYLRDLDDWLRLCKSCHHAYDNISQKLWASRRANVS